MVNVLLIVLWVFARIQLMRYMCFWICLLYFDAIKNPFPHFFGFTCLKGHDFDLFWTNEEKF